MDVDIEAVAEEARSNRLTIPDVARILDVSVETAYRMAARGDLKVGRVGRRLFVSAPWLMDHLRELGLVSEEGAEGPERVAQ